MRIDTSDFRVPSGKQVKLKKWPTGIKPLYKSEKEYADLLTSDSGELNALQRLLYASNRYSLLPSSALSTQQLNQLSMGFDGFDRPNSRLWTRRVHRGDELAPRVTTHAILLAIC